MSGFMPDKFLGSVGVQSPSDCDLSQLPGLSFWLVRHLTCITRVTDSPCPKVKPMENTNNNAVICAEVNRLVRLMEISQSDRDALAQTLRRDLCKMKWEVPSDKLRTRATYNKGTATVSNGLVTTDGERFPEVFAMFSCLAAFDNLFRKSEFKVWDAHESKAVRDFTIRIGWEAFPETLRTHFERVLKPAVASVDAPVTETLVNLPTTPVEAHVFTNQAR